MGTTYLPILLQKYLSNPANKALSMSSFRISNVADPVNNQDVATRAWVIANTSGGGGSLGALPFNLTSGSTSYLTFAVSGNDIALNNPNTSGKILINDTDGFQLNNTPTTITDNTTGNALTITNSNLGDGMEITNTGGGNTLHCIDSGTGVAMRITKSTNGRGLFINKTGGNGAVVDISDAGTSSNQTILINKTTAGDVITMTKTTGVGNMIDITDAGTSESVLIRKNNIGRGISIIKNASDGGPLYIEDRNNGNDQSIYVRKETGATGHAVEILKNTADIYNALRVVSNSATTAPAVEIVNTGVGDTIRILDQLGDSSGFKIDSAGHVGINESFTGSITNRVLSINNGGSSIWDTNGDITLGTITDLYLGQQATPSRPRMRMTFRNEASGPDFGTIYFQYLGNSLPATGNQRFSFTKSFSNEATLNILPYSRKVMIGNIDSASTPGATLGVVPPATTTDPTVFISRNTTGTLRNTLECDGSLGKLQVNNEGNVGIGYTSPMSLLGPQSVLSIKSNNNGAIYFSESPDGQTSGCAITSQISGSTRYLQITNNPSSPLTDGITIISSGQNGSEVGIFDATSFIIGSTNFNLSEVIQLYNGGSGQVFNLINASTNPISQSANFVYSDMADLNLFGASAFPINLISVNDQVRVIGPDLYDNPNTNNITFKTNTGSPSTGTMINSKANILTIRSEDSSSNNQPIKLSGSEIQLSTSSGGALRIRNLSNPLLPSDAATKAYVDSATGGGVALQFMLSGPSAGDANNWPIINLPLTQVNPNDATSKNYVDTKTWTGSSVQGFQLTTNGNANNNQITNLSAPSSANQAMRATFDSYPSTAGARQAILTSSKPIYGAYTSTQFWLESTLNPVNFSILPGGNIYLLCSSTSTNLNMQTRTFTNAGTQTPTENGPVAYAINNPQPGLFVGTWVLSKPGYYRIRADYTFGAGGVQLGSTNFSNFRICQSNVNTTPVNTDYICNPGNSPYEILGYLGRQSANTVYLKNQGELITSTQNGVYITFCVSSGVGAPSLGLGNLLLAGNTVFTFDYLGEFYA